MPPGLVNPGLAQQRMPSWANPQGLVPGVTMPAIVRPQSLGVPQGMNPWNNPMLTQALQRNPGIQNTLLQRYGMPSGDSSVTFPTQYGFLGNQQNSALMSYNPKQGMAAVATPNNPLQMGRSSLASLYGLGGQP